MRDEDIVAAARTIRTDPMIGSVAEPLDDLLARADAGERVADDILELLTAEPALREEMRRRLPQEQDTSRTADQLGSYQALPGHGAPSAEILYRCSTCDYEYPIFEVGEPVPDSCPRGHGRLDRIR
ncbi:hypothetical protein C8D87_101720 [Lentzea atacamensis]|uniref:Uncharacterized protein n=1 Tax=Lentzea atacamensis TaxID=531938 RepID=A0ABX9EK62_9PSEU|nr:hypothetical protein [Lentzea atacamensis]RAS70420.1 hypothetical protein C8D87_101720 [Lentzea atacamensis]